MLSATARLHIMWLLAAGECDVSTLADQVGQSVATVSHHLAKLKLAGLVRAARANARSTSSTIRTSWNSSNSPCATATP
jgi:DNA-binding transcriptional ArsR family regulator